MSDKIGQRFTAHETLETSKLGTLVRATDDQLGTPALVLRLSAAASGDEATLAAVLADNRGLRDCPQALLVYCTGRDDQGPWIAVEATEGCPGEELLRRRDKLEMAHLLDAALAMAKASAAAATAGAWIGDLGPHRLWLQGGAAGGKLRTFGYGWWRLLPGVAPGSTAESFFGAPEYLAAEACKGNPLSAASDIYGAATAVWALAAGKPPFHGPQPLSVVKRQAAEKPLRLDLVKPALKGVKDLQAALVDALDKDPAKRPTAAAWQQTLQAAVATWGPLPGGDDVVVPQRGRAFGEAPAATTDEPAPTVVVKIAAEPAPATETVAAAVPVEPTPAPEPVAVAAPAAKAADPDATAVLTPIKTVATTTTAPPAGGEATAAGDDEDDGDDDDEATPAAGAGADTSRRSKKGKKSRRDRDRGGPQAIAGKSAPTPIASPVTKADPVAKPEPAKAEPARPEPAKSSEPTKPVESAKPVSAAPPVAIGGAAAQPKAGTPATTLPAPSSTAAGTGRTIKTTDRIRVEAMHESAFFSHDDKHEVAKDLHDQGPPVPPPQKVNKLLLGTVAAFAIAMVAVAVYIKVNAPPEPPPVPAEGSEAAVPAPAPAPTPVPEPVPTPASAADVGVPAAEPAADAAVAAPDVAVEVAESPSDHAARLVEEGQALLRAGTLDQALGKAKEAQTLHPGNAQAAALQKQIEQAQADAAVGAAAAAAKAEADNKAAAEAEAQKKAAAEAAAKQAAADAEKAEAERKKGEEKAAKQAEAEHKKQQDQAAKAEAAKKKAESEANKAEEARKKKEEAAAKKADDERKKAAEAEKARKADEARKKKEDAAVAKKEVAKPPKVEKADKPPPPPAAGEANEAQKEAAKFAALAQKATTAKLKVLYLRKAVDRDPANGKFKQMLKDAEAELAAQPN